MGIITIPSNWHPSYKSGYARNASEAADPNLWQDLVFAGPPSLGVTGLSLEDIARGNTGTLTDVDMWAVGDQGPVLETVRSSGDYVAAANIPILGTSTDMTFSIWVKLSTVISFQWLMNQYDSNGPALFTSSANIHWQVGTTTLVTANDPLTIGVWTHICCTIIDELHAIYVNGKLNISGIRTRLDNTGSPAFSIGGPDGAFGVASFGGQMNMPAAWARAVAPSEVQALYEDRFALIRPVAMPIVVGSVGNPWYYNLQQAVAAC